jgi:hypothetical protein
MESLEVSIRAIDEKPRWYALLRRWPTALGFGIAALTLADFDDGRELAIVLLIASVGYLLIAAVERPRATWWILLALLAAIVAPSLAEWCAVLDTVIALGILILVWT